MYMQLIRECDEVDVSFIVKLDCVLKSQNGEKFGWLGYDWLKKGRFVFCKYQFLMII